MLCANARNARHSFEESALNKKPAVDCSYLSSIWTSLPEGVIHGITNPFYPDDKKPPVVLVHGLIISSLYMLPTARQLGPLCKVLAPDFPGFGKSYKPKTVLDLPRLADVLARWLDKLSIEKAHFVGNSFGCQIIAEFALRHEARIDRIVLQGPTVDPLARSFPQQFLRLIINGRKEPRSLRRIAIKSYITAGLKRAIGTVRVALDDRIEEKLPYIHRPVLVVSGSKDPMVPRRWAEEVTNLLPQGKLKVLPGLPHTINYSAPLELVRVIKPFLNLG